jgi:pimeloyl-ACP methyl ester carboxylesterase
LQRHYDKAKYADDPKVNLVGHSMGGLIIAGYLERYGKKAKVNRVITLATPFRGSFEAVIKVTTGTANLGTSAPSSREREAARITPALYHLLPAFERGILPEDEPGDALFDPANWQPTVLSSIEEFVRNKGLLRKTPKPKQRAADLFAAMLKTAQEHRQRVERFKLSSASLSSKDWLAVVGVDCVTRVRLRIARDGQAARFDLSSSDRDNQWHRAEPDLRRMTGDGTVPFEGAMAPFLPEESLVCVSPDDFGYWEIQDKLLAKAAGFHGILPNMNMIHRLAVRFLTGAKDRYGNTWGRRVPGVSAWQPPLDLREKA